MKVLCPTCELPYRCQTGGVNVVEVVGRDQEPYQLWKADLYRCPGCGAEVVTAFGGGAFLQQHEERFPAALDRIGSLPATHRFTLREFPKEVAE